MQKLIRVVGAAMICGVIFTGCGGGNSNQNVESSKQTEEDLSQSPLDGTYVCEKFNFTDEKYRYQGKYIRELRAPLNVEAIGVIKIAIDTLTSNNLGTFFFNLEGNKNKHIESPTIDCAGFLPWRIFQITDTTMVVSAGGYFNALESPDLDMYFTTIHRIHYERNKDGSITLKNFDITGGKYPETVRDLTFHIAKGDDANIEWMPQMTGDKTEKELKESDIFLRAAHKELGKAFMPTILKKLDKK